MQNMPKKRYMLTIKIIYCNMENIKHYFAGINSKDGFVNNFNNINTTKNGITYILKGGPGTGKSTLMKKVGMFFATRGEQVDFFHCSSDVNSLDGIFLPTHGVAIVDGTAPHIIEATMPAIKENLINLGEYINQNVQKNSKKVEKLLENKKKHYNMAYMFLKCAGTLFDANEQLGDADTKETTENLLQSLDLKTSKQYKKRELFLTAVDTKIISLLSKNKYSKILCLNLSQKANHIVFAELANYAEKNNISHTLLKEVLNTSFIEAIEFNDINLLIYSCPTTLNKEALKNQKTINLLTFQAGSHIEKARKIHKKVEKIYIKHTNFDKITQITEDLIFLIQKQKAS